MGLSHCFWRCQNSFLTGQPTFFTSASGFTGAMVFLVHRVRSSGPAEKVMGDFNNKTPITSNAE